MLHWILKDSTTFKSSMTRTTPPKSSKILKSNPKQRYLLLLNDFYLISI